MDKANNNGKANIMKNFTLDRILNLSKGAAKALHVIQFNKNITTRELSVMFGITKAKMRIFCKELSSVYLVEEYNDINGSYGERGIQYTSKV